MAKNRGGTESMKRKIDAFNRIKTQMPKESGKTITGFLKSNFEKQGFQDATVEKWEKRKKRYSHPILLKSGALRRSIKLRMATWNLIKVESDLPYSAIHNYGKRGKAWGKHPFKMPKRQFMGNSRALNNILVRKMETSINRAMRA
jgi:phage gpG-like protein